MKRRALLDPLGCIQNIGHISLGFVDRIGDTLGLERILSGNAFTAHGIEPEGDDLRRRGHGPHHNRADQPGLKSTGKGGRSNAHTHRHTHRPEISRQYQRAAKGRAGGTSNAHQCSPFGPSGREMQKTMAIRTTLAILGTNLDFIYVPFYPPLDKNAEGHFPVAPMGKFR